MKRKLPEAVFRRIAAREGVSFRQAIRVAARRGGRRSGEVRRKAQDAAQPPLL